MNATIHADLAVIGGGSGGLSVAAGAAQMGASVVLIEKGRTGGDCLNYGCVPSKSLIAAAHAAQTVRSAGRFGVNGHEPAIDFLKVRDHVRGVIAAIAPHDSVERFEDLGVRVVQGAAVFTGPREIMADGQRISARRFVIATGSSPAAPPVPGLDAVSYLTNETIFELDARPEHLIVLGGGPIGLELAQAHRRLGARVTIVEAFRLLGRDDPDAVAVVKARLEAEGIAIHEQAKVSRVAKAGNGVGVAIDGGPMVEGSHLLVAAGRRPNVNGLGLEAAGVEYSARGITVDARLRTTNRRIFAIGDVAGGPQFTHVAGYHAGVVIRNALFRMPAKADHSAIPAVTYTDPELAQVGLSEAQAREMHGDKVRATVWPFEENDRAQAEGETEGMIKVVTGRGGRVLGTTIVGAHAGELIMPWVLAVSRGLKIGAIAGVVVPYPTRSEISKRVAGAYFTPALFSPRTRKVVRALARLG